MNINDGYDNQHVMDIKFHYTVIMSLISIICFFSWHGKTPKVGHWAVAYDFHILDINDSYM